MVWVFLQLLANPWACR